ncbi:MAG TPA: DUF72 domain-containing protein [Acidimicrobiia bacterium]|nr:DUF72 domain-containing protein [Acidimicrobiia bacterium]
MLSIAPMAAGRFFVGTSGFAYKEWVGPFYPPGTKSAGMLPYYAGQFSSVEINYTFRRNPTPAMIESWTGATPDGFVFALKANQGITHFARLKETAERLGRFFEAVAPLGSRLGPVLFQCPPNMKYEAAVLDGFLGDLAAAPGAAGRHFAMEFRHPSFDSDEVRTKLAAAGVALCVADTSSGGPGPPETAQPATFLRTCDFAYVRLRGTGYDEKTLEGWGASFRSALAEGADVYCYLKHEDSAAGPRDAAILKRMALG